MAGAGRKENGGMGPLADKLASALVESSRNDQTLLRRASDRTGSDPAGGNGSSLKLIGLVGTLASVVIFGLAGFTRSVEQQVVSLKADSKERLAELKSDILRIEQRLTSWQKDHETLDAHAGQAAMTATLVADGQNALKRVDALEAWKTRHETQQQDRFRVLERELLTKNIGED